jgi:nitronate monooxygenase
LITERLGMRLPIIQAPMAGISTPAMAAAVADAGGLGSLGLGAMTAAAAQGAIDEFRQRCGRPLHVNLFVHRPARERAGVEAAWLARLEPEFARAGASGPTRLREIYRSFQVDDDMLAMLLQARPAAVSFHFGIPDDGKLKALHQAGILMMASATSLAEAQAIAATPIDVVVAQGYEAGGHRGVFDPEAVDDELGTLALVRGLVRNLDKPVVAAGGIMDGAGIKAALDLGAVAAQMGTAFVGCDESLADAAYRNSLLGDAAFHTVMTRAISGRPARCLPNRFTALGANVPDADIPDYPRAYDAGKALHAAARAAGDGGYGAQWAGQGAPLARSMSTAALMTTLEAELGAC